jgi:Lrp/AsnC family leucine-responsive transcriptional regulator
MAMEKGYGPHPCAVDAALRRIRARIERMDDTDRQILALLLEDGRRTYDDVAARVSMSAPSAKRRIDRLRASGVLKGFTAVIDHGALGYETEALIELFYGPAVQLDEVAASLRVRPEVVEAWSVTGEPDAIARVRTRDNADLERLIRDLQRDGAVVRTRSQVVLSRLVGPGEAGTPG